MTSPKYDTIQTCKMFQTFLNSMKIVALHFDFHRTPTNQRTRLIEQIYCLAVTTMLGLNTCRMFSMFNSSDGFHSVTIQKCVLMLWFIYSFLNAAACFRASCVNGCLPEFFLQLYKLHTDISPKEFHNSRRTVVGITYVTWVVAVINISYVAYCLFSTNILDFVLTPFDKNWHYIMVIKVFAIIAHSYSICAWIFSISLNVIICIVLKQEFSKSNKQFENLIRKGGDSSFSEKFNSYYDRHQAVHQILRHAEDTLSFMNAVLFVSNICLGCMILYNLISYPALLSNTMAFQMHLMWLLSSLFLLGVACLGGSVVNNVVSNLLTI